MGQYIRNLSTISQTRVSKKVHPLLFLTQKGYNVPATYICTLNADDEFVHNQHLWKTIRQEINELFPETTTYALRPVVNVQDSWFKRYRKVQGSESMIATLKHMCQVTTNAIPEATERASQSVVMIQSLPRPEYSGVLFTKNPLTGFDETIIESVSGLRDASAVNTKTHDRWVYKWSTWMTRPLNHEERDPIMLKLVKQAQRIATQVGNALELEWLYDGHEIYWLHFRPLPVKIRDFYSNRIAKEVLPGIIKPLIWSVNIPVVNSSWKQIFRELMGNAAEQIDINKLAKSFYYRAYFNMGVIGDIFDVMGMPRESIELVAGIEIPGSEKPRIKPTFQSLRYVPRTLYFALNKSRFSNKINKFLTNHRKQYDIYQSIPVEELDEATILHYIEQLVQVNTDASYVVIITQLLQGFYNMLLHRYLEKHDIAKEQVDFSGVREQVRDIDPRYHMRLLHEKYQALSSGQQDKLQTEGCSALFKGEEVTEFRQAFESFLTRFGHLSDSGNDFSVTPWKETPEQILETIIHYAQPTVPEQHETEAKSRRGLTFHFLYDRAAKFRAYREQVTFLWTYGYGLFRPLFLRLGELLTRNGIIEAKDDIFYLYYDEITTLIESGSNGGQAKQEISRRKVEIERYRNIQLPEIIYDDMTLEPLLEDKRAKVLTGIASSQGYYVGTVKVIRGIQDFNKILHGDVLAIPFSDVSWTPLFAKAKAVISESGGLLSHCSIVARELNIPAVVSVQGTMQLEDNTQVAVDGYKGKVTIIKT